MSTSIRETYPDDAVDRHVGVDERTTGPPRPLSALRAVGKPTCQSRAGFRPQLTEILEVPLLRRDPGRPVGALRGGGNPQARRELAGLLEHAFS